MNQAAPHLANRNEHQRATKKKTRFLKAKNIMTLSSTERYDQNLKA